MQVPDGINDLEATFTEPLAAACRILEQQVHLRTNTGELQFCTANDDDSTRFHMQGPSLPSVQSQGDCFVIAQAVKPGQRIAVIGDGKFGLLIAQNLVVAGHEDVTHFGRHRSKLDLVEGTARELVADDTAAKFAQVNHQLHLCRSHLRVPTVPLLRCQPRSSGDKCHVFVHGICASPIPCRHESTGLIPGCWW